MTNTKNIRSNDINIKQNISGNGTKQTPQYILDDFLHISEELRKESGNEDILEEDPGTQYTSSHLYSNLRSSRCVSKVYRRRNFKQRNKISPETWKCQGVLIEMLFRLQPKSLGSIELSRTSTSRTENNVALDSDPRRNLRCDTVIE